MNELYKYKNPVDEGEAADRLELIEDRQVRGLFRSVVHCTDWRIQPTVCLLIEDVEKA
jgi:hypothetical protein